ncbi:hypothetical protein UA74_15965 [Actinoalloteichus fjordicus]|uniref:Uncharacterized protein n=1 Tax=Actinoalloteichus fjordicus TaxID=1612552 RepID=A0AAC9LC41_9PSEU|nr:hypothetical protein UA74_15965 [Actinoalloteichus fjordicus]
MVSVEDGGFVVPHTRAQIDVARLADLTQGRVNCVVSVDRVEPGDAEDGELWVSFGKQRVGVVDPGEASALFAGECGAAASAALIGATGGDLWRYPQPQRSGRTRPGQSCEGVQPVDGDLGRGAVLA